MLNVTKCATTVSLHVIALEVERFGSVRFNLVSAEAFVTKPKNVACLLMIMLFVASPV